MSARSPQTLSQYVFEIISFANRFVFTQYYIFKHREKIQRSRLEDVNEHSSDKRPLGPITFLIASYALYATAEKIAISDSEPYELPETVKRLTAVLDILPENTTFIFISGIAIQSFLQFAFFRLFQQRVSIDSLFHHNCYATGGIMLPFNSLLYLIMGLAFPRIGYNYFLVYVGYFYMLTLLYQLLWIGRQISEQYGFKTYKAVIIVLLSGSPLLLLTVLDLEPRKKFIVSDASNIPAIEAGDLVLVNNWVYNWRDPYRGEYIAFYLPNERETVFLKRIVGLPNDRIQMIDGVLHINGKAVSLNQIEDLEISDSSGKRSAARYQETLPNGVSYEILDLVENGFVDNTPVFEVPEGHYFTLGDNRDDSLDSRLASMVGYVPRELIMGPVYRRILPMNRPFGVPKPNR